MIGYPHNSSNRCQDNKQAESKICTELGKKQGQVKCSSGLGIGSKKEKRKKKKEKTKKKKEKKKKEKRKKKKHIKRKKNKKCHHYTLFMFFYPADELARFCGCNLVHSFHGAHTVLFCLTADHISTCLMMFSARFKPAQFWSVLKRGEWKCSICSCQHRHGELVWTERVWKPGSLQGVAWRARVETLQLPCGPMDSECLDTRLVECLDSWQRMQWYEPSLSVTTAGNGCSGMQRLPVSRQLVTDTVERSVYM